MSSKKSNDVCKNCLCNDCIKNARNGKKLAPCSGCDTCNGAIDDCLLDMYESENKKSEKEETETFKKWVKDGERHKLIFTPYHDDTTIIAELFKSESGNWYYSSELLCETDTYLADSYTLEHDVKVEVEERIYNHYEDEGNYYNELMEKFGN